jgi:polyphosphate kinase
MGSADLMPRNLDHRVEVLFPVRDERLRRSIVDDILAVHLRDAVNARALQADGSWKLVEPVGTLADEALDSQQWMLDHAGSWSH